MRKLRRLVDYATIEPIDSGLVQPLLVAAGGGRDADRGRPVAAQEGLSRPVIATWAWDRLIIDPLPGPRGITDFEGLEQPADNVHLVTGKTRPIAPAGSPLPDLADALDADLVLLDPGQGCLGLAAQIEAAAGWCGATHVMVVEVGGDALARPGDPGLRSPMADITSVVATAHDRPAALTWSSSAREPTVNWPPIWLPPTTELGADERPAIRAEAA